MANFSNLMSRRWTTFMLLTISVLFILDITSRYNKSEHVWYKNINWLPQKGNGSIQSNKVKNEGHLTLRMISEHIIDVGHKIGEKKTDLVNAIRSLRGNNSAVNSSVATGTTKPESTTEAIPIQTLPGIVSMDRDLSLPPPVPKRPDSKEQILEYSQKRDYPALISHDDKCGPGDTVDLTMRNFNYKTDVFLLMVVKSACSLKGRRSAIRSTWGNESWIKENLNVNVKLLFLLGNCVSDSLRADIKQEDEAHGDLLQWDFFDSFRNLTLKDCLFLQWFSKNCRNVPYVFKGDDDVFVNVRNVVKYLKDMEVGKREELFVGSVLNGSPRILNPSWKYYVSYNLYPDKYYPAYVSGGGFVMSGHLAVRLFQASLFSRIIPIDDAFLGILLKKIKVKPQNDRGFKSWGLKKYHICRLAKIKTYHKMLPDQLTKAWTELLNLNISECGKDTDDVFQTQTKR